MKKAIAIMLSVLVLFAVVPAGALQASALENGDVQLIRRAETLDDYFATLNFDGSEFGKK